MKTAGLSSNTRGEYDSGTFAFTFILAVGIKYFVFLFSNCTKILFSYFTSVKKTRFFFGKEDKRKTKSALTHVHVVLCTWLNNLSPIQIVTS